MYISIGGAYAAAAFRAFFIRSILLWIFKISIQQRDWNGSKTSFNADCSWCTLRFRSFHEFICSLICEYSMLLLFKHFINATWFQPYAYRYQTIRGAKSMSARLSKRILASLAMFRSLTQLFCFNHAMWLPCENFLEWICLCIVQCATMHDLWCGWDFLSHQKCKLSNWEYWAIVEFESKVFHCPQQINQNSRF